MAISVVMPALEMAQETGKLISWLKQEGDCVVKGEPLLEIETDKAVMEIESPGEGILAGIKAQPGTEVPVGRTIAWIVRPGESAPTEDKQAESARKSTSSAASVPSRAVPPTNPKTQSARVSPKARRLAAEKDVNLHQVQGSGPNGEILASDILAAAASEAASSTANTSSTSSNSIARIMAERTTQSWTTVPHFFLVRDVDASSLKHARETLALQVQPSRGIKLTVTDLLVALVAPALAKHPRMNARWKDGVVQESDDVNISLAIAVEGGVVAPVIHRADRATLEEIAIRRAELTNYARTGKLKPADIAAGTFTISNLGMFGIDAFSAIITPPQAAILAVGRIAERVVAVNGQPVVRPMMTLTLSSDHRVVDGARAAEFLTTLAENLANPQSLLTLPDHGISS
jgi:pyruvate dehydrogenase E2 component (dihydrolipoamide acetyltransferase)